MTVELEVNGRRRRVGVTRAGDRWLVTIDGRELSATVAESGGHWSVLVTPAELAGGMPQAAQSYDVALEAGPGGRRLVHVNGTAVPVAAIEPRAFGRTRRLADADAGGGPARVLAPMPGRIVRILVQPGDAVAARQAVVVIEAMKMENELRAARAGVVAEVRVTQGMSVEANAVLVVLE